MSGLFKATADELSALGAFLDALTEASCQAGVKIYSSFTVQLPDEATIEATWDEDALAYVISDLVGG